MIIVLLLLRSTVSLSNDTLVFVSKDSIIEQWILNETSMSKDSMGITYVEKARISNDSTRFLFYQEEYERNTGFSKSTIRLYTAEIQVVSTQEYYDDRRAQFDLCEIQDEFVIIADSDLDGKNPRVQLVCDGERKTLVEPGCWLRIVDYTLSSNYRYILFHTHRLHNDRAWDFLYFLDIDSGDDWEYFFPICLSCKKTPIDLSVENNGQCEVVYKQEHRIFSQRGQLTDIFFQN